MYVIETDRLTKHFGPVRALAGIDLRVPAGSIFGFLGPNGAGKTTAMRILMGLLRASAGRAMVLGLDAWSGSTAIKRRVGYLPGDVRLYDSMRGKDFLRFCDRARGGGSAGRIARLAERFELNLDRRIRDYSRGMKQKLGLVYALMHQPELLILDEPTSGLDPLVQQTLHDELRRAVAAGGTLLFSSHTLGEVELLCDRVAIIRTGRIIEDSTIEELRRRAVRRVEFRLAADAWPEIGFPADWVPDALVDGRVCGGWKGGVADLLAWLSVLKVTDVVIGPPDLESLFAAYYREQS